MKSIGNYANLASAFSIRYQSAINQEAFDIIDNLSQSSWSESSDDEQENIIMSREKQMRDNGND